MVEPKVLEEIEGTTVCIIKAEISFLYQIL